MKVKDFVRPATVIRGDETLSSVVPGLDKTTRELVILDDKKKFKGMVSRHTLLESVRQPANTKLRTLMFKPHTMSPTDDLDSAIESMLSIGVEALPVTDAKNRLLGLIVIDDLLEQIDAAGLRVADVMSSSPITVPNDVSVTNARTIMSNHGISRLLVVDDSGKLEGVLSSSDILKTAFKPPKKLGQKSFHAKQSAYRDLPVSAVMTKQVITCASDSDVNTVIDKMLKHNVRTIPVVEEGFPIGMVTRKQVLQLVRPKAIGGIRVNISGIKDLESFEIVTIRELIVGYVKKIGKSLETEHVDVAIKKIGESKYEANVRAGKGKKTESTHALAFDVVSAVSQALKTLERKIRHS